MSKYGKVKIRGKKYYRARITEPNGNRSTLYGKTQAELATKVAAKKAELASHGGKGNTCPTVAEYAAVQLSLQKSRVRPATYVGYEAKVRLYIATPPLGYMAHGLFCSLLIGTILKTLGQQISWQFLVDVGQYAFEMAGPAMAATAASLTAVVAALSA